VVVLDVPDVTMCMKVSINVSTAEYMVEQQFHAAIEAGCIAPDVIKLSEIVSSICHQQECMAQKCICSCWLKLA